MYKCILPLVLILSPDVSGENLIKSLWNNIKSNQNDLSKSHSNITKVGNMFYYYKLKPDNHVNTRVASNQSIHEYDQAAIAEALEYQNSKHPDNEPLQNKIASTPQTDEQAHIATQNEKKIVYGDDSPLQDDSVIDAWERANQAKKRLDDHRAYMERVRKARKTIEQSKTTTIANQTAGASE